MTGNKTSETSVLIEKNLVRVKQLLLMSLSKMLIDKKVHTPDKN